MKENSLVLKPKFSIEIYSIKSLWFLIPPTLILLMIKNFLISEVGPDVSMIIYPSWAFLSLLFITHCTIMPFRIGNYRKTEFTIMSDRIISTNSFLGYFQRELKFRDVVEVTITQGILQRQFGLGDIYLVTNATPGFAGLRLFNVSQPIENYSQIKQLVETYKNKERVYDFATKPA